MNIRELININMIELNLEAKDKNEVIEKLACILEEQGKLKDKDLYIKDVLDREKESTTGVGRLVAIPHGKSDGVKETSIVFARIKEGIDWDSLDGQPVNIVFLLAVQKKDASDTHLRILSKIAMNLMEDDFIEGLLSANKEEEILNLISAIN
ncbi:PTS mannose transporter subunit IIAB [Clostridium tertium]|uniref:PTS system fructose-specific EIIABC component n=1 Tax=Clostridium tertium TaxID=1559 RepID=A0A6N3AY03_9CLOT